MAVSLDQPLLPVRPPPSITGASIALKSIQSLLTSSVFKLAVVAVCLSFGLSLVARSVFPKLDNFWKLVQGRVSRVKDSVKKPKDGVAMTFESDENVGWGVCSLRSKKRLGKSSFVQYDFDLPEPDKFIQLDLGQQLSLCCLDNKQNVAKGDFYLYHGHRENAILGTFSILAPNRTPADNAYEMGKEAANFVSSLFGSAPVVMRGIPLLTPSTRCTFCSLTGASNEGGIESGRRSCYSTGATQAGI